MLQTIKELKSTSLSSYTAKAKNVDDSPYLLPEIWSQIFIFLPKSTLKGCLILNKEIDSITLDALYFDVKILSGNSNLEAALRNAVLIRQFELIPSILYHPKLINVLSSMCCLKSLVLTSLTIAQCRMLFDACISLLHVRFVWLNFSCCCDLDVEKWRVA